MNLWKHPLVGASSLLIGTTIGAGIFGIPFVVAQAGIVAGIIIICLVGFAVLISLWAYAEVIARTNGIHQLPGYAYHYLGRGGKIISFFTMIFGIYGALTAYTIGVGHLLFVTLHPLFGGSEKIYGVLFIITGSFIIWRGLIAITRVEKLIIVGLILLLFIFGAMGWSHWQIDNLRGGEISHLWPAYGVILFAFIAAIAIPEMRSLLVKKRATLRLLPRAITIGTGFSAVFYILFTVIVISLSGNATTPDSIVGAGQILGKPFIILGALFGALTMGSSFLVLGMAMQKTYQYDFKLPKTWSGLLMFIVPLGIYLADIITFIQVLGIVGAVTGGIEAVIILRMHLKARRYGDRRPEFSLILPTWLNIFVQGLFILGIIVEITSIARAQFL